MIPNEIIELLEDSYGHRTKVLEFVSDFFDSIDYVDHSDEEMTIFDQDRVVSDTIWSQLLDLYQYHLNRVAVKMDIHFNKDVPLMDKYIVLSTLEGIKHLDNDYIALLDSVLEEHDKFAWVEKIILFSSKYTLQLDIHEIIYEVGETIIETINCFIKDSMSMSENSDMDKILFKIKQAKKRQLLRRYVEPNNIVSYYINNNTDHINVETMLVLFKTLIEETGEEDRYGVILTLLILGEYEDETPTEVLKNNKDVILDFVGLHKYENIMRIILDIENDILNIERITL